MKSGPGTFGFKRAILTPPGSFRVALAGILLGLSYVEHAAAQAPVNDNLAGRIVLSGALVSESGTNANATREVNEFDQGFDGDAGGASVWYEWTAPSSGPFLLDTQGSIDSADGGDLDTNVGIFTSDSADPAHTDLNLYVVNDEGYDPTLPGISCEVIFLAEAGTTYFIGIDTFSADGGSTQPQGAIALSIAPGPLQPVNDDLATAELLASALPVSASGNNRNATRERDEPFHGNQLSFASLWYQWTPANEWSLPTARVEK